MSTVPGPIRELSYEERLCWGECPVCKAPHGEGCHPEVGIQLGVRVGGPPKQGDGVHIARISRAPMKVREVEVR